MPDSMIERVARALLVADRSAITPDYYQRMARAAIEAMREPTEAVQRTGLLALDQELKWCGMDCNCDQMNVWQAMIDAALSEAVDDHD